MVLIHVSDCVLLLFILFFFIHPDMKAPPIFYLALKTLQNYSVFVHVSFSE